MESKKRSIVKTIFFKIITTCITIIYIGDVGKAILLHVMLTLVYLGYERIWNKIHWGRSTNMRINDNETVSD